MAFFRTWRSYLGHKVSYSATVSLQKYNAGRISELQVWESTLKNIFQGKITYLCKSEGEQMAPTIIGEEQTLLVRKLPFLDSEQSTLIRTLPHSVKRMEGDGDGKRDLGWKYAFLSDPNNKNDVSCKLCQKVAKGGIYRLKQHLAGGYRNIKACNKCPEHVRQEIIEYMVSKKSERDQMNLLHESDKVADLEEEEIEFFMTNDPRGKRPMSAALSQASVAKKARARQVGPMDVFCTPKAVTPQNGKQNTINEAYRKEQREKAAADVARWLYDAGIPFNALNYPSFKVAMDSVARAGIGQKPLSAYEARVPLLRKEVQRTNDLLKKHREEWARTGCSIMSDGWEDRCHRSILNFLVNCSKGSMFIESMDASSYSKTGDRLYRLLSIIIEKVGEHNVVQVITDNGSNFVAAGALLEAKYPHLYWTPCAAHCIDLMLEDISKIPAIDRVLKRAIHMTSFIYQRPNLINLMRQFSGQRNLLRPAKTRFATAFITLSSIHKQRDNLRKLFTSQEWVTSKWAKELGGKRASQTVLMPTFWNGLVYALKLTGPLVRTLRLVDGERKPAMGYIYEAMDRTKEIIASTFNGNESKYIDVFQMIDNRWECQLHRPLHAAGHFLNPKFFYNNPQLEQCEEVVSGLYQCIQRLVPIIAKQDKIMEELTAYKNADGLFGNPMAIRHRKTKAPAEWWAAYGSSTPTLQQFAVKILSLTCSSSGCERNWSIFEHIHTKKRNRLAQSRLNDLVYVKYNRALIQRYQLRDKIDPISLKDIDESNEWLTGRIESDEEGAENDIVFEEDDLNWGTVAAAAGVDEERFNLRFGASGGSSSSSQRYMPRVRQEIEEEEVEDDDEGYGSESEADALEDEDLLIEEDERAPVFVGDVVALKDPYDSTKHLVRRLAALGGQEMVSTNEKDEPFLLDDEECWVLSDNKNLEVKKAKDSRLFGPVRVENIAGRVIYCLRTPEDHGPIINSNDSMEADSSILELELDLEEMAMNSSS